MFNSPDQFSNASKARLETSLATFSSLSGKAFEGVEKMFDLYLSTARASVDANAAVARQLLAAKDPQEFFALAAAQTQPNVDKLVAYNRSLAAIASEVQAEFSKAAESQIAENGRKLVELVEELTKNAPAGSENAVAMLKSAIGNANAGYEQFSKTAKQAAEVVETNVNNAVSQFTPAAKVAKAKK